MILVVRDFFDAAERKDYRGMQRMFHSRYDSLLNDDRAVLALEKLANQIDSVYTINKNFEIIDEEESFFESNSTFFLVVKLSSQENFGYYFFNITEQDRKIIEFSEFTGVHIFRKGEGDD